VAKVISLLLVAEESYVKLIPAGPVKAGVYAGPDGVDCRHYINWLRN